MVSTVLPLSHSARPLQPQPEWQLAPLELMLPTGRATHSHQLGSRSLPSLLPPSGQEFAHNKAAVDLLLLAPTGRECATPGWLASAVAHIAQTLTPNGLACLAVPPRWRLPLLKQLSQYPLTRPAALLHYPHLHAANDAFITPLHPTPLAHAFATLAPGRSLQQTLTLTLLRLPLGRFLLSTLLPAATLVLRRPGALPLFNWLADANEQPLAHIVISFGCDGNERSAVLHTVTGRPPRPTAIHKVALNDPAETARRREADNLGRLPLPGTVRLPATRPTHLPDGRFILRQEPLTGRVVARLLATQPARLPPFLSQVVEGLEQWQKATITDQPADPYLERAILEPARQLTPFLPNGNDYRQWLCDCVAALAGRSLPFVAAHHDLTMWNLLYDEQAGLAVLDWEAAEPFAFPLTDFYYALTDAAAAAGGYRHRMQAFRDCFELGGRWNALAGRLEAQLCQSLALPPDFARLCFHACWLHHAANEQRKEQTPAERPFLAMVAWTAQHRTQPLEGI